MKVLVVVPAYNEEKNILNVIKDLEKNSNFDFLIINDFSKDNTESVVKSVTKNIITSNYNIGLTKVIQAGLSYAEYNNYDCMIQFDGDGQHMAKYLNSIVEKIKEGNDIVIGSRFLEGSHEHESFGKKLGSFWLKFWFRFFSGKDISDPTSGMRAYSKDIIKKISQNPNFRPEPDSLIVAIKSGYHVAEVQVEMQERKHGTSYLNSFRSIEYMIITTIYMFFSLFWKINKK